MLLDSAAAAAVEGVLAVMVRVGTVGWAAFYESCVAGSPREPSIVWLSHLCDG